MSVLRPSPTESATRFAAGTEKRGNDGRAYAVSITKNGVHRWVLRAEKAASRKSVSTPISAEGAAERQELARWRDRWQVVTGRSQDLDDIKSMSSTEVARSLREYTKPAMQSLFWDYFDTWFDWEKYYKKHDFLVDRPFIKERRARCPDYLRCSKG